MKENNINYGIRPATIDKRDDDNINNELLCQWARGERVLYLGDDQNYPFNWVTQLNSKEDLFKRLNLFAELISDPIVLESHRNILLRSLYERLWWGLLYPEDWTPEIFLKMKGEFNAETLEWCEIYGKEYSPLTVQNFCKNAKLMLSDINKYNSQVFNFYEWLIDIVK